MLQAKSFAGYLWLGQSHEVIREVQPSMRLFKFQHVLLTWPFRVVHLRPSCKFTFFTNLYITLTLNSYIKSHKKYKEMIEQNTIKFDME